MKNVSYNLNREAWLDNVRMLAMVFVMLGHTWRLTDCPLPEWLNDFILSFNMPLFVILSGYAGMKAIRMLASWRDLLSYFEKISMRIMVPAVLFSSLTICIATAAKGDFKHFTMHIIVIGALSALLYMSNILAKTNKSEMSCCRRGITPP